MQEIEEESVKLSDSRIVKRLQKENVGKRKRNDWRGKEML